MDQKFLQEMAAKIAEAKAIEDARKTWEADLAALVAEEIPRALKVAREYDAAVQLLGVRTELGEGDAGFSLKLLWQDDEGYIARVGEADGLRGIYFETGEISPFHSVFASNEPAYDRGSWSIEMFEQKLKEMIATFIERAPAHQGL